MFTSVLNHKKVILVLLALLGILGFITYSFVSPYGLFSGLSNDLKEIEKEGEVTYTDLEGNPVSLKEYKGKPLIINAWASWTPFSQNELSLLAKIKKVHGDRLSVIAINRMESIGMIRAYLEYIGKPEGIIFLADPTDNFYKIIGGYAMPETMFYDSEGVSLAHTRGVLTEEDLMATIDTILD